MFIISKNRWIDTFMKLLLITAFVHFFNMLFILLIKHEYKQYNYFNMLDFEYWFPNIGNGILSDVIASTIVIVITLLIFFFYTKKK